MNDRSNVDSLLEISISGEQQELGKSLILAARAGETQNVANLLKVGAPFATDWWGLTCLHHAALGGHLETCELLVKSGIARDTKSKVEKTPLHLACQEGHADVAMFLITQGADIHATDMILMTPLHWAVEMEHVDTVLVLLQNGADPSRLNKFDKTCFSIASDKRYENILELLRAGPHKGNWTISELVEPKMSDMIKRRINAPIGPQSKPFVKRAYDFSKNILQKSSPTKRVHEEEEIRQLLEEHGIEMLEGEDINLVATAVDSGQTVILTEAGKQALTMTETLKGKQPPITKDVVKYKTSPSPNIIRKKSRTPNNEDIVAAVAEVTEKYIKAKREANQYKIMYTRKQREVEEYHNKLQSFALQSIRQADGKDTELLSFETDTESDILLDECSDGQLEEQEEVT